MDSGFWPLRVGTSRAGQYQGSCQGHPSHFLGSLRCRPRSSLDDSASRSLYLPNSGRPGRHSSRTRVSSCQRAPVRPVRSRTSRSSKNGSTSSGFVRAQRERHPRHEPLHRPHQRQAVLACLLGLLVGRWSTWARHTSPVFPASTPMNHTKCGKATESGRPGHRPSSIVRQPPDRQSTAPRKSLAVSRPVLDGTTPRAPLRPAARLTPIPKCRALKASMAEGLMTRGRRTTKQ
ncbi:hypothetical protein CYFUS_003090 [Cystobacter fuscus]|uniref:Uncharacterized protein n=1 Tax=Cystobacter fuscus TaxID=43 RepID=A0A250J108_9BACT|nr:hypothetical protein CYFUS_003090 [Cystobacter fuscus]